MFKELYPSDLSSISFETCSEWLPFFGERKKAINSLTEEIIHLRENELFALWSESSKEKFIIHAVFDNEEMLVKNVLRLKVEVSHQKILQSLIELAKKRRLNQIILPLDKLYETSHLFLVNQGYTYEDEKGYVLNLSYCTGLVLGGGGARGAYQIGVWRGLKEMGIPFELISGTSVGALNGGLILQGELDKAIEMWESISTDKILDLPSNEGAEKYSLNQVLSEWQQLTSIAIQSSGVNTAPLLHLINELLEPEKIMAPNIPFYVVATSVSTKKEKVVSLKEMTEETLPLWLLASSSFYPAMQATLIDDSYYIDGGYKNNVPKDILVEAGATELIVADVSGPGLSKKYETPVSRICRWLGLSYCNDVRVS